MNELDLRFWRLCCMVVLLIQAVTNREAMSRCCESIASTLEITYT